MVHQFLPNLDHFRLTFSGPFVMPAYETLAENVLCLFLLFCNQISCVKCRELR